MADDTRLDSLYQSAGPRLHQLIDLERARRRKVEKYRRHAERQERRYEALKRILKTLVPEEWLPEVWAMLDEEECKDGLREE